MSGNLFVVISKKFYYYAVEDSCVCPFLETKVWKVVRRIVDAFHLPYFQMMINPTIRKSTGKLIVSDAAYGGNKRLLKAIRKATKRTDQILYYMNKIDEVNVSFMRDFDETITFDKEDSFCYHLKCNIFPYTDYYSKRCNLDGKIEYDLIFLGRAKGRIDELLTIKVNAEEMGLKTNFMVFDTDNDEVRINHYMDYQEYISLVIKSRCIVEILRNDQEGASLRTKEALFLKKKLISNNVDLKNQWFYDKPNMYIIGNDDRGLKEFVEEDYLENNINLNELNFKHWIEQY